MWVHWVFHPNILKSNAGNAEKLYLKIFLPNSTFTIHWDGKVLEDCTDTIQDKCNRLAIILSSCGNTKVLGIPKVVKQTGAIECEAIYSAAIDWKVEFDIMAMCLDTTSSKSGPKIGACSILENKLRRRLLNC